MQVAQVQGTCGTPAERRERSRALQWSRVRSCFDRESTAPRALPRLPARHVRGRTGCTGECSTAMMAAAAAVVVVLLHHTAAPAAPLPPCALDPALPPNLTVHAAAQPLCAGFLDPTLPPYAAAGDGSRDDTVDLQAALDDAYAYRLMVRLPARRTFLVTRQLRCVQQGRPPVMREYGYQLVGGGSARDRPVIRLADNAHNVSDGVLLYFQLIISADEWPFKGAGPSPPSHYSAMLRNVIVDMGTNPTVSAVSMSGAQLCSIEDILVRGAAFKAGVVGLPGSGGFTANLRVEGGELGIWQQQYRPNPSVSGAVCIGQSVAGVRLDSARGPLVLSGFRIEGSGPGYAGVRMLGSGADASLALEDGSIVASHVAIDNTLGKGADISLRSVWFAAAVAVSAPGATINGLGSASWGRVDHWSYSQSASLLNIAGTDLTGKSGIAAQYPENGIKLSPSGPPPPELDSLHSWMWTGAAVPPMWLPSSDYVVDVARDFGATPAWVNATDDDGLAIQAALSSACPKHAVFIPHGVFHVGSTVWVPPGCSVFGAGKHVATVSTLAGAFSPDPAHPVVSLQAGGTAATPTFVSDLVIQEQVVGNERKIDPAAAPLRTLLEVRGQVVVRDIRTCRDYVSPGLSRSIAHTLSMVFAPASTVSIVGAAAGGRFFGLSLDHVAVPGAPGGSLVAVNNTGLPVHLYQCSAEHLVTRAMVVIFRSANVHLHAFKFESAGGENTPGSSDGSGGLLAAHGSHNVSVFGGSGNYGIMDPSLSRDIFFSWGGNGIDIAAIARHTVVNESGSGMWAKSVLGQLVIEVPDMPPGLLRFRSTPATGIESTSGAARRGLQPQWEGPAASPKPRSNSELVRIAPSPPKPEMQLLSRGATVETDVRGNLGPASTLTNAANADWLKDRWQVRMTHRRAVAINSVHSMQTMWRVNTRVRVCAGSGLRRRKTCKARRYQDSTG